MLLQSQRFSWIANQEGAVSSVSPSLEPSCMESAVKAALTVFPLSFSLSESLSSRYMILEDRRESETSPHHMTARPGAASALTCMWAPKCVAVCPSSLSRCRRAAAAAGHRRRWWTCSWTKEAPPPCLSRVRPPEGFQHEHKLVETRFDDEQVSLSSREDGHPTFSVRER